MGYRIMPDGCEQSCLLPNVRPPYRNPMFTSGQRRRGGAARLGSIRGSPGMKVKHTQAATHPASGILESLHVAKTSVRFDALDTIFAQGDRCASVMFIERGRVKLSVVSPAGKAVVVAELHAGAFFGEGALAGQRRRKATASAMIGTTIAIVKTAE